MPRRYVRLCRRVSGGNQVLAVHRAQAGHETARDRRSVHRDQPGSRRRDRRRHPVGVFERALRRRAIVNICWPRTPEAPRYDNYVVLLMSGAIISLGILYMVFSPGLRQQRRPAR
ncbi:hypothetical protein A4G28_00515 [Mycobacterium ostraviense]|uniref:Uncharacterized protein n=1 Tax=Mycobacterium ostraviense TaxID=2738409 RepID=A0A168F0B6_9MYCO|nr:hypothetical protein A4G28_00515 [Mycobacterium ostraviense]